MRYNVNFELKCLYTVNVEADSIKAALERAEQYIGDHDVDPLSMHKHKIRPINVEEIQNELLGV